MRVKKGREREREGERETEREREREREKKTERDWMGCGVVGDNIIMCILSYYSFIHFSL